MREFHIEPNPTKNIRFSVALSQQDLDDLRTASAEAGVTLSEYVRQCVRFCLGVNAAGIVIDRKANTTR